MTGADAIFAGFADTFVPSERLPQLGAALEQAASAADVDAVVARFVAEPPPSALAAQAADIDRLFAAATVEGIVADLAAAVRRGRRRSRPISPASRRWR